jgi:nitroreductase
LPIVGEHTMSTKLKACLLEVGESLETWPQLASDVALGAGLVTNAVRRVLLDDLRQSGRYFVDLDELVTDAALTVVVQKTAPSAESTPDPEPLYFDAQGERAQLVLDPATIAELVRAATLAPSGGNEQPWRWVTHGPNLSLLLDEPFGELLLNHRNLGRRIALGAAAENLVLRAHALGLRVKIVPGAETSRAVAEFKLFPDHVELFGLEPRNAEDDALALQIERRATNRRVVPYAPLGTDAAAALHAAIASLPGCRLHLVTDATERADLADIVGSAERIRMLHPVGHRDLVREVRWTGEEAERTRDGIDLRTLELTASESAGLWILREPAVAELLRRWKLGHGLEKLARKGILAASAVGIVTVSGENARDQFSAGRAVQRVWLTATKLGLGFQPLTSTLGLFGRAFAGDAVSFDAETLGELERLKMRFDAILSVDAAPVFLFRIFPGCEPPARSLRRTASIRAASANGESR